MKRMKTNRIRRARNRTYRSNLKTAMKKVLSSSDPQEAAGHLQEAISLFDKYARRGIIHKNTAARKKSRLMNHVRNLGS
jgi:small subunit ribosomal protein S20